MTRNRSFKYKRLVSVKPECNIKESSCVHCQMQVDKDKGAVKHSKERADEWHSATSKIARDFLVKQVCHHVPCAPTPSV